MPAFEPIAIIGQGCVLPGAASPDALWQLVDAADDALGPVPDDRWNVDPSRLLTSRDDWTPDHVWTDRGGFVQDFQLHRDDPRLRLDDTSIEHLDPVFLWTLEAARQALADLPIAPEDPIDGGLILGNKFYPTTGLADYADAFWRDDLDSTRYPRANRYCAGLPAPWVAQTLGLSGPSYALDTACASSLYAIERACRRLHRRQADLMLAGGVNATDDLFLRAGFCSLNAMSDSARCRPFHRHADGLLPAEGAAIVALKRLDDARQDGDPILGVIRGVGLSNDGHSRGALAPSASGQVRAIEQAYDQSGLSPDSISLLECHAAGTPLGDATEVQSLSQVFQNAPAPIPIASLKANLGHLITVSGAAALLKCLAAIHHRRRPPSLHSDAPIDALRDSPHLRLLQTHEEWPSDGPRRCGINNFGFGGNNAHLIVEEYLPVTSITAVDIDLSHPQPMAVIGLQTLLGDRPQNRALDPLFAPENKEHVAPWVRHNRAQIDLKSATTPPRDLERAMAQQLLALQAAQGLQEVIENQDPQRTGVAIGMEVDPQICRYITRWRHGAHAVDDHLPDFDASAAMGTMPNLITNRINRHFDLTGPSLTTAAGRASGTVALLESIHALRAGQLDAAIVGAVDVAADPIHRSTTDHPTADAAVMMVLKPLDKARDDGDPILATLDPLHNGSAPTPHAPDFRLSAEDLYPHLGDTHAAAGLLTVAALIEATARRQRPLQGGPWLPDHQARRATAEKIAIEAPITAPFKPHVAPTVRHRPPQITTFSAPSIAGLIDAIQGASPPDGPHRLAIVSDDDAHLRHQCQQAVQLLTDGDHQAPFHPLAPGIYLGHRSLADEGDLAFVFTGPAGAYPQMGRHLIDALPQLVDRFAHRADHVQRLAQWIFDDHRHPDVSISESDKLWGASVLCQLHAHFSAHVLSLSPDAAIGFCAGETNALFALGAWSDIDGLYDDLAEHGVFHRLLGGDFQIARQAWGDDIQWQTWRVLVPREDVAQACADEPRCALTIINAPGDLIIGGHAPACRRVIERVGRRRARQLPYNMSLHCPAAAPAHDLWQRLHHRPTAELSSPRFYSLAFQDHYQPSASRVADALVGQALHQVDFPALVERAYDDGVRIFLEHGPRSGCARWIGRILGDRPHAAIALDRRGQDSLHQAIDAAARLWATGLQPDLQALANHLTPPKIVSTSPQSPSTTSFELHRPPLAFVDPVFRLPEAPSLPPATEPSRFAITTNDRPDDHPVAQAHQRFLRHRAQLHRRFLEHQQRALQLLLHRRPTHGDD